ncbi:hypothetical protein, partial [Leisingera daeponensis]|uniref:hypothetical protein n=1 Tax=Leisingera daeponensis TaxID=405746 RepID=UPI001C98C1C4
AAAERNQPSRMASSVSSRSTKSGWVPSSETACVAGRNIGGMVYVGTPPLLNTYGYRDKCRAYIDPSLVNGGAKSGHGAEQKSASLGVTGALANALPT